LVADQSQELNRAGHGMVIDTMLQMALDLHDSTVVVASTPYPGGTELARQSCLTALAIGLDGMGVYNVTADDRRLAVTTRARDLQKLNRADQATIASLRDAGTISPFVMLERRPDQWEQLLWLPVNVCALWPQICRRTLRTGSLIVPTTA